MYFLVTAGSIIFITWKIVRCCQKSVSWCEKVSCTTSKFKQHVTKTLHIFLYEYMQMRLWIRTKRYRNQLRLHFSWWVTQQGVGAKRTDGRTDGRTGYELHGRNTEDGQVMSSMGGTHRQLLLMSNRFSSEKHSSEPAVFRVHLYSLRDGCWRSRPYELLVF